jgi:mannose-1-phosphate guanylyltransferase
MSFNKLNILLLAGGFGTRLRPLTDATPKCLVEIDGRPLLSYWLNNLFSSKYVDKVMINTHHLAEQVKEYINSSIWRERIIISHEEVLLGTAGTIIANQPFFSDKDFCVIHADNFSIFNFDHFIEMHNQRPVNCVMTMMTFLTDDPISCGTVSLDENNIVIKFEEKKSKINHLANAAIYVFDDRFFELIKEVPHEINDISTQLIELMIGKIFTYPNYTYHRDIGNLKSLKSVNTDIKIFKNMILTRFM